MNYEPHEYANLFPMMSGDELKTLIDDMLHNGFDESSPIVLFQNKILDGRNRLKAAIEAKVKPVFDTFKGSDPLGFVIRHNLNRRHLNETQRYGIASKLATMKQGERTDLQPSANLPKVSQKQAAEMLNVSDRGLRMFNAVAEKMPELVPLMESGQLTANKAYREIKQKETRETRKAKNIPDGKYTLIYADPPWRYDFAQSESREIENQYPTMDIDAICALPINSLADDDCVLFLWGTNPKLREALQVIEAWGFEYKTNMVWIKDKIGMGYYARQKHELLLIATKGNPGTPEPKDRPESTIFADREKHSRKPCEFYELLETMYPHSKKIELFSRLERDGWSSWGNE